VIDNSISSDAIDPALQFRWITQCRNLPMNPEKNFLQEIVGIGSIVRPFL
jgi:hypothetical protein